MPCLFLGPNLIAKEGCKVLSQITLNQESMLIPMAEPPSLPADCRGRELGYNHDCILSLKPLKLKKTVCFRS